MIRGLNALAGGFLFFFGGALFLFGVDGSVPFWIGVGLLAVDLLVEHNQAVRREEPKPVSRIDTDPWGRL